MKSFFILLLILALNQNNYFADHMEFEKLLGKHVSVFEETIGDDFENKLFGNSFYYISDEFNKKYYSDMQYHNLTISTNQNHIVESISIHFPKVIDRQFYDSFIEKYGEPNKTQVIDKRHVINEGSYTTGELKIQKLSKSELEMREGTFDEKPLFIIWEKEHFYIQAFLRHKQNISEITFSLDSPIFNVKSSKKN